PPLPCCCTATGVSCPGRVGGAAGAVDPRCRRNCVRWLRTSFSNCALPLYVHHNPSLGKRSWNCSTCAYWARSAVLRSFGSLPVEVDHDLRTAVLLPGCIGAQEFV